MMSKKLIISTIFTACLATDALAAERIVKCQIGSGATTYKGTCIFTPGEGGSFTLRNVDEAKPIVGSVSDVNVYIVEKGVAEVRGLTTDGINSRWGEARRSTKDKACWVGSDFSVCAW